MTSISSADQGTEQWRKDRRGRITASRMGDVVAYSKDKQEWCVVDADGVIADACGGGATGQKKANAAFKKIENAARVELLTTTFGQPLQSYFDYRDELVVERLGGEVPGFGSAATAWGQACEPAARALFEAETGWVLNRPGLIVHPDLDWLGASPDATVNVGQYIVDGLEIKSPYNSRVHLETLKARQMPEAHAPQVQTSMLVTGSRWWHFMSFDPRLPARYRSFIQKIERDEAYIAMLLRRAKALHLEVEEFIAELAKVDEAEFRKL